MSRSSLKASAVAAVLSAVTTFLLWLLPRMYRSFGDAAMKTIWRPQ